MQLIANSVNILFLNKVKIIRIVVPVVALAAGAVYYFFDPESSHLFPRCMMEMITHAQCPACGLQRALYDILHGHILEGLHHNYFLVVSIPFAVAAILSEWYNINHCFDKLHRIVFSRVVLSAYVYLFILWWILRNILGV